ncbi:MAG: nucleoside hydrolase-like domain-containing protein [Thalassotalea sp.]
MNKTLKSLAVSAILSLCTYTATATELEQDKIVSSKPRLIIMADMGHDPDEEQQITHLLISSNMFQLEGLIAVTGRFFRANPTESVKVLMPQLFHRLIDGYEKIYPNLKRHAQGWHKPNYLRSIVANGQTGNGVADIGAGKASPGSKLIIAALTKSDPRPLHIVINAGANTLAQALFDFRATHSPAVVDAAIAKLRVFENSGQDDAGAWICHEFPNIHWIRGVEQTQGFGGPSNTNLGPHNWQPYPYTPEGQHQWAQENITSNHGALGALSPIRKVGKITHYIEGGGTIPWLGLVAPGLSDLSQPSWGGWSGRYTSEKVANVAAKYPIIHPDERKFRPYAAYTDNHQLLDRWVSPTDGKVYHDIYTGIFRWRTAMWNDYKARMDWSVQPYDNANHHPIAVLNGDASDNILKRSAKTGDKISFDAASSTDPDGDALRFSWWVYTEAGKVPYRKPLAIENATAPAITLLVPDDAKGKELHLILEVWDHNTIVPLVDYRRVVLTIE